MSLNAKRPANRLYFASLLRGVIVLAFLGAMGLSYLYLKHQLYICGVQRQTLERELNGLIAENNALDTQIGRLTSRAVLQRRLDEGFIKLVPISAAALVRVHPSEGSRAALAGAGADSQLQTVSHETAPRRAAGRATASH